MTHPVRYATYVRLFMVAVLATTLVTPTSSEAIYDRYHRHRDCDRSVFISGTVLFVGALLLYIEISSWNRSGNTEDADAQEHTLQLPVITYKKEAALKNLHSVGIRLAPAIERKCKILELKGTRKQLNTQIEAVICDPISRVKGVNRALLGDIQKQCHVWFSKNRMVFPHEVSGFDLKEAFNVVLPELVYRAKILTLSTYQVSLNNDHKKDATEDMSYFSITMSGFQPNEHFKTCYHYPRSAGMNPPMMDSNGELVFKLPKQGVTHLHQDGHAEYILATHLSGNQANIAYAWKLGAPWPPLPAPVRLTAAAGEIMPIHVIDQEQTNESTRLQVKGERSITGD